MAHAPLARLGVNLDHIATLRRLRDTPYPSLQEALALIERAGAQQVTAHLREDRRHIQDWDVAMLRKKANILFNFEMAAQPAMLTIARKLRPDWACLVPERREEVTTEGGLDLKRGRKNIERAVRALQKAKIKVSLFVEPSLAAMREARELGADAIELHTGSYCGSTQAGFNPKKGTFSSLTAPQRARVAKELARIEQSARLAKELGLGVHAGHGFDYENVRPVAAWDLIQEYNIGHAIIARAALVGLERATREMLAAIHAP